jgi:2'-5' RNA ligase
MAGRFWPWVVLNEVHPLLHVGCGCRLFSYGDALAKGMMAATDVMSNQAALRLAAPVIQHVRDEKAEAERKYGPMAEDEAAATEELLIREALLDRGGDADALAAMPLSCDPLPAPLGVIAEAEEQTGAMVALFPDRKLSKKLALPGGDPPEQLHVTLAFLGKAADLDFDKARAAVEAWAKKTPPLSGELSGIGHFDLGRGEKVTYRSVDLPELPTPREGLIADLDKAGVPPRRDHGFSPRMTIDSRMRRPEVKKQPITFAEVTLAWGGERHPFPLRGGKKST